VTGMISRQSIGQIDDVKTTAQHIETLSINDQEQSPTKSPLQRSRKQLTSIRKYPFLPTSTPNSELPFIPASEVDSKSKETDSKSEKDLWIVIDGIVYDCSEFVHNHPGGEEVIKSFKGQDCLWQFWRFHGKEQMETNGLVLRIGRTGGIRNRFQEYPRYVGLRSLGATDDEWGDWICCTSI
jgi:Cytochrome b involved in lipid metabolism